MNSTAVTLMTLVRIGSAVWQTGEPRVLPLARSRPQTLAVWSRTAAVLALTGTLAATTLVSTPKAEQAMDDAAVEEALPKDAMRVEAWQPPGPQTAAAAAEGDGDDDVPATGSLFAAKATAVPVRFGSLAEPIAAITRFKPWAAPPPVPAEWHE